MTASIKGIKVIENASFDVDNNLPVGKMIATLKYIFQAWAFRNHATFISFIMSQACIFVYCTL